MNVNKDSIKTHFGLLNEIYQLEMSDGEQTVYILVDDLGDTTNLAASKTPLFDLFVSYYDPANPNIPFTRMQIEQTASSLFSLGDADENETEDDLTGVLYPDSPYYSFYQEAINYIRDNNLCSEQFV